MADPNFLRHIKKLVILAIFSDDELLDCLVLKGGNLLDVVYELSARASVDIDFSIDDDFEDVEAVKNRVSSALSNTFREYGYVVFDFKFWSEPPLITENMKDFWGGYKVAFKIIDQDKYKKLENSIEKLRRNAANIGSGDSTVFKIDISRHEFCEEKQAFTLDDYKIFGYSPTMFIAEKLRALCQQMPEYVQLVHLNPRPRARDFLDIFIVSQHYAIDWHSPTFLSTVRKTFGKKRVPLQLIEEIRDSRDQHADNFQAVRDTVNPGFDLQEFDFYFDYVRDRLVALESLWNE